MILNEFVEFFKGRISIHARCETKTCERCGRDYASRGKRDIGICKECERETTFYGGALDGKWNRK